MGKKEDQNIEGNGKGGTLSLKGMYKDYFLDYASYVILERAVPAIEDGLKPVQRRILHAMKMIDDGRFHKVANIIGQTMQYHPHGDAAIGDALVNLGQKDLLIDTQGNWGDVRTGDPAAASRYIEARLTKFALDVIFNPQTTEWQLSYDGRKKEPVTLPVKFPLLLAQGVEGIAVGLSTRIMPHNFIELIEASIKVLKGRIPKLYPDFQTGGLMDVSDYNQGERGGRIRVRSRIEQVDKKTLAIREIPYGVTTTSLIDSIIKANDKGKIKIKQVIDNTAKNVEVLVELASGVSPDITMDALYAFTNCEVSISPNACVIIEDKPHFLSLREILQISTENTKQLLKRELEIKLGELEEKWHFASLEKIFIEKRVYRDIEECETWEAVLEVIDEGLKKYVATPSDHKGKSDKRLLLKRDITQDDIIRLTEIKIKRISKYNTFKADEQIAQLEEGLDQVKHDLAHLIEFAIAYFENLLEKYGKGRERRTEITSFEQIDRSQVVAKNTKLYVNRKEGFVGAGLKREEFVCDCSDIDDIIVFRGDGRFVVTRIDDKTFVGKDIWHVAVWTKGDERTTYNMVYRDGKTGRAYAKRFNVKAITRDKEYALSTKHKDSKALYFSAHPNGEAEVVTVTLTPGCRARKKVFDFDFGELDIKGRGAKGNIVTKYPVRKVAQKEVGRSTLGAQKWWMDEVSGRLNTDERGVFLGDFDTGDHLFALYNDGAYEVIEFDQNKRFDPKELIYIGKFEEDFVITAVYYDGEKGWTLVKRFLIETSSLDQRFSYITEHRSSKLLFATVDAEPVVTIKYKEGRKTEQEVVDLEEFIDIKGWKALGNKLLGKKATSVKLVEDPEGKADENDSDEAPEETSKPATKKNKPQPEKTDSSDKLHAGDTIEFDLDDENDEGQLDLDLD